MSTTAAPNKQRSPNYPAISLAEALIRLKPIYAKQRRYPAPRAVLAQLMGYSSLNGASATIVSALSKYGLLEGHGDDLRVSELGQDLMLHRKGDPEYTEALQAAAFMPAFFRELRDQYPRGLPSEHSLRANLVKRGFNPKAIDSAIRAYRDTIEFVDAETGDALSDAPEESPPEVAMQTQPIDRSVEARLNIPDMPMPNMVPYNLPLGPEGLAVLHVPAQLSEASWTLMMKVLEAMKPGIVAPVIPPAPAMLAAPAIPTLPATIPDEDEAEPGA